MSQALSQLPVGALVKDTGTTYNGTPIVWRVLEHGHTGDPTGSTTLESKDILTLKCFDAKEPNNSDTNRQSYGNNRYLYSNILQWMNSVEMSSWYAAQHEADQAPDSDNVYLYQDVSINPYDEEAGFLTNFSSNLRDLLQNVSKTTVKNTITDGGSSETVTSKLFLLSRTEVGFSNENSIAEGSIYSYYSTNNTNEGRQKNIRDIAAKGNYPSGTVGSPWHWWLRTPRNDSSAIVRIVSSTGEAGGNYSYISYNGLSPAFCIPSATLVSDTTDSDGAYTIQFPAKTLDSFVLPVKDAVTGKIESQTFDLPSGGGGGSATGSKVFYGTCDTAADTVEKVVTCTDFTANDLVAGTILYVTFDNANSSDTVTLNVNSTGAVSARRCAASTIGMVTTGFGTHTWAINQTKEFIYTGTYWDMSTPKVATTDSFGVTRNIATFDSGTASTTEITVKRVGYSNSSYEFPRSKYMQGTVTTSTSGTSSITFSNSAITTSSIIEVFTSVWDVYPSAVSTSTGSCTLTFPKQSSSQSVTVRIYIS